MKSTCVAVALTWIAAAGVSDGAEEATLTIYNQQFAVVRERLELELKDTVHRVQFSDITAHLEPDSVILREVSGKHALRILEQNYRADPLSEGLLLSLNEGKTIDFQAGSNVVRGTIVRSGYVPHRSAYGRYGSEYTSRQQAMAYGYGGGGSQPIVEVDGRWRFGLPGTPLFPKPDATMDLKPTLDWLLESDHKGRLTAELSYVTGGLQWEADYNLVAPEKGDAVDLVGWITMDNQSGRTFENATIKLMAGDVNKIKRQDEYAARQSTETAVSAGRINQPVATEKTFDEYHLYTLTRAVTLRDRETKQIEFVRAAEVASQRLYVYDGVWIDAQRYRGYDPVSLRQNSEYGTLSNPKVWVMREFANTEKNHLGLPLPKGRVRFYRRDSDGRMEFTGEHEIDHTPRDETIRVYTGNAFDLVGSRKRTQYKVDSSNNWMDEAFEIRLRNHKKEAAEVTVVEHLYRWHNWEIKEASATYLKKDAQTMEFRVQVPPDEERVVTYLVHYSW